MSGKHVIERQRKKSTKQKTQITVALDNQTHSLTHLTYQTYTQALLLQYLLYSVHALRSSYSLLSSIAISDLSMWQALLAAAVAGSTGLVAKHLFKSASDPNPEQAQNLDHNEDVSEDAIDVDDNRLSNENEAFAFGSEQPVKCESLISENREKEIFRFSSTSGKSSSRASQFVSRSLSKRLTQGTKKGVGVERSRGSLQRKSGRKVGVCLKKRKTIKNVATKCGSCSPCPNPSDSSSVFGWGLGVGVMYMMSAGRAEISQLNTAMCETAKVVQELKAQLDNRKLSRSHQVRIAAGPDVSNHMETSCPHMHTQLELSKAHIDNEGPNHMKVSSYDDGECGSSILTEEPHPEAHEMDQLEAELETELQKLPWCIEPPSQKEQEDLLEIELSAQRFSQNEELATDNFQNHGVLPSELDQKLCHVLIQQQESQIEGLETELHSAQSKLHQREAELQALKDCVKRLTEFSLIAVSDDETGEKIEQELSSNWKYTNGSESETVGMKRPINSESCSYYV